MIKWQLYREKCEYVEDQYADFKRLQKRIYWLLCLVTRTKVLKRLKENFELHRAEVMLEAQKEFTADEFRRCFKRYLRRLGRQAAPRLHRDTRWIRQSLTIVPLFMKQKAERIGAKKIYHFLLDEAGTYDLRQALKKYKETRMLIASQYKRSLEHRQAKIDELMEVFDQEKKAMIGYYSEPKQRKVKKYKQLPNTLRMISEEAREKVIKTYYYGTVVQQNLMDAIYYVARLRLQRLDPSDSALGPLTDLEHKNLLECAKNKKAATAFLAKGTKREAAVGTRAPPAESPTPKKRATLTAGQGLLSVLQASGEAEMEEQRELSRNNEELYDANQDLQQAATGEDASVSRQPVHALGRSPTKENDKKSAPKKATSNSRTRVGGHAAGKKGGKKKKAKDEDIQIEHTIPEGKGGRPAYLFAPDRAEMQRMVTRAAALKPDEEVPRLEEVRPWMRLQNQDVHV
jgi:hypothetical protein